MNPMDGIEDFGLEMAGSLPTMETFQDQIPAMRFYHVLFPQSRLRYSTAHSQLLSRQILHPDYMCFSNT